MSAPSPLPPGALDGGWLVGFSAFSLLHGVVLAVCIASILASSAAGRRWRDTPREVRLRREWALGIFAWQSLAVAWYLWPSNFELSVGLPLHLCDLTVWIAGVALWTRARWARALLYFWGLGFSTQGFITPVLQDGPGAIQFWFFWIGHLQIVGSAVYDVVAGGFRPARRDWAIGAAGLLVYAAVVIPLNHWLDLYYGYVGRRLPEADTVLDLLGPYPWRILAMAGIAQLVTLLMWLVWPVCSALVGGPRETTPGPTHPGSA